MQADVLTEIEDWKTGGPSSRHIKAERHTYIHTDRETDRQTDAQTDRQIESKSDSQTDRQRTINPILLFSVEHHLNSDSINLKPFVQKQRNPVHLVGFNRIHQQLGLNSLTCRACNHLNRTSSTVSQAWLTRCHGDNDSAHLPCNVQPLSAQNDKLRFLI